MPNPGDQHEQIVVEQIGYVNGTVELEGRSIEVIGLIIDEDDEPAFYMTLAAAKSLRETLQEAIDVGVKHASKK